MKKRVVGWDRIDNLGRVHGTDWLIELEKKGPDEQKWKRSCSPVNSKLLNCSMHADCYSIKFVPKFAARVRPISLGSPVWWHLSHPSSPPFLVYMARVHFKYGNKLKLMLAWISQYPLRGQRYPKVKTMLPVRTFKAQLQSWEQAGEIKTLTNSPTPNYRPMRSNNRPSVPQDDWQQH